MLRTDKLVAVIYSAGKVFENLRSGRLATAAFLENGTTDGISSRADLQLLQDLQAAARVALRIKRGRETIAATHVCEINAAMTRSAALHPGELRREEQRIGVRTVHGDHMPPALDMDALQLLIDDTVTGPSPTPAEAARLFVVLARAQPFEDGNKRTAILAANALLPDGIVLVVPHDREGSGAVEAQFHDLLARAYVCGDEDGRAIDAVVEFMLAHQAAEGN